MIGRVARERVGHVQQIVLPAATRLLIESACRLTETYPLGTIAKVDMGSSPPGETCNSTGDGLPLLGGPADLGLVFPEPKKWTTSPTKISRDKDILVCVRATIGEPRWSDGEYCVGRGLAIVRPSDRRLASDFLFHVIEGSQSRLREQGTGTTFKTISKEHLETVPVPMLPVDEQVSIGRFLRWMSTFAGVCVDWDAAPPLPQRFQEQRRIVARIESLSAKIEEASSLRNQVRKDLSRLLNAAYHQIADKAPRKPLGELAPLQRRPVTVDFKASYPQVAVRSFGRGTFHKPPLIGSEVTWEKPFLVKAGDILVSNIKAWEGAIAVAGEADDGRVGSHRYLTFVAKQGIATARFICFHLLTSEGLYEVGEASPGSADRNRTLGAMAFMRIPVPMPEYGKQLWFDALYQKINSIAETQSESAPELAALLPSILDKAFKGEL